ncbi:MAG: DUF1127 domain-containing protein [Alphaproteobacteria bacterium]
MIRTLPITISEFDLGRIFVKAAKTLHQWHLRAGPRRRLGELDRHALRDIGLTEKQAKAEARKPFWWH